MLQLKYSTCHNAIKDLCATTKTNSTEYIYVYIHMHTNFKKVMQLANVTQSWDLYWEDPWTEEDW